MDLDEQISLGHLLFYDRKCHSCKQIKSLIDDFYRTRKNRGGLASSYSYECKECTIKRIKENRKNKKIQSEWSYPDW
jgi:hypothetical protein